MSGLSTLSSKYFAQYMEYFTDRDTCCPVLTVLQYLYNLTAVIMCKDLCICLQRTKSFVMLLLNIAFVVCFFISSQSDRGFVWQLTLKKVHESMFH